ncbi:MAG: hypothetical protein F4145_14670 [Boseongicola sp. SB0675_bin_26]|nr:hypothetical protein [Boseongicola sp. SB0675_bin_26]
MVGGEHVDAPPSTAGTITFPAGSAAPMHGYNCDEQVTILEGRILAEDAGIQSESGPMDTSFILVWLPHRFVDIVDGDLKILRVHAAAEVTRTFTNSGETRSSSAAGVHGQTRLVD